MSNHQILNPKLLHRNQFKAEAIFDGANCKLKLPLERAMASMASDHFDIHFCLAFHCVVKRLQFWVVQLGLVSSKAAQV